MWNANTTPIDSYLDRHACSGRNITWHYMNNAGVLPAPYNACPYANDILITNCCFQGRCKPLWPSEIERYEYDDWDGLGDPYNFVTNRNGTQGPKPAAGGKKSCWGRTLALLKAKEHWPPLGLDGLPMENFKLYKYIDHIPPYVQIDVGPLKKAPVKRDVVANGGAEGVIGQDEELEDATEDVHCLSNETGPLGQTSAPTESMDKLVDPKKAERMFKA